MESGAGSVKKPHRNLYNFEFLMLNFELFFRKDFFEF